MAELNNDFAVMQNFMSALDPHEKLFIIQWFNERPPNDGAHNTGTLQQLFPWIQQKTFNGKGVGLTVNVTDGYGRSAANVTRIRALFADFDNTNRDNLAEIANLPVTPHIVVNSSPGKYHAYWLVHNCPVNDFKPIQRAIAKRLDSDKAVVDPCRAMRLPGTWHQKREPYLVNFETVYTGSPYPVEQVVNGLGLQVESPPVDPPAAHETSSPEAPIDDDTLLAKMLTPRSSGVARQAFGKASASFTDLWENNEEALSEFYPCNTGERLVDSSLADMALAQHLAFWTAKNHDQIARLMQRSALVREKWEERPDYLKDTILKAVNQQQDIYTGGSTESHEEAAATNPAYMGALEQLEYFKDFVYIKQLHRVLTPDGDLLKPEVFNASYGGHEYAFSNYGKKFTRKSFEALTESQLVGFTKVNGICFRPDLEIRAIIQKGNKTFVNTYLPAKGVQTQGDVSLFLNHAELLMPNANDREIFLSYLAACVQYVGKKFQWCPLLQGAEGNGKTFFFDVMSYALGEEYTHVPRASDLENNFTGWIEGKLFICISEIRVRGQDGVDILKPMITDKRIEIHHKGQGQYTGDNRANFLMFSNFKDAVLKTLNDRRYCCIFTAQQELGDFNRCGMNAAYFKRLWNWLDDGGHAHIAHYLQHREINVDVMARAPDTTSTPEAIEKSKGIELQIIEEGIELEEPGLRGGLICTKMAAEYMSRNGFKKISPQKITSLLHSAGYIKHPALAGSGGKIRIKGERRRLYVLALSPIRYLQTADQVVTAWENAQQQNTTTTLVPVNTN